jgi:hypothetical protein
MADPKHRFTRPTGAEPAELEIEGARTPSTAPRRGLSTGSLAIESEDSHDPYKRIPDADRKRASGTRTDLRKLSAWIKMMRSLEEAKKRRDEED